MLLPLSTGMQDLQNRQLVRTQLNAIDTALANFVAQNKRLPCPANGSLPATNISAGLEEVLPSGACGPATAPNAETFGVVPWVTLGMKLSDVTDPWKDVITYRVDFALTSKTTSLMNMSSCDPAGTMGAVAGACTPSPPCTMAACTSPQNFLVNKGLDVWDTVTTYANRTNNRSLGTGAAYVTISHGPNMVGAYNAAGNYQTVGGVEGTNEKPNQNKTALALPATQVTAYVDAPLNDIQTPPANHFDDYLSHPTVLAVLNAANLGPRAH
jgi:hypothetical protein